MVSTPRRPTGTAVWPRPTHAGNEKHLGGYSIVEACDLDMALKLAAEGPEACNRKAGVRRNAASDDPHCANTGRTGRWQARLSARPGREAKFCRTPQASAQIGGDVRVTPRLADYSP